MFAQRPYEEEPDDSGIPDDHREFIRIPIDWIVIDPELQRDVENIDAARTLGNEWEWDKSEVITVRRLASRSYRAIEGQRRTLGLRSRGYKRDVWVAVTNAQDETAEADIALGISTGRRSHTPYDKWKLRLAKGDPHEVAATRVLNKHRLRVGKSPSSKTIAAVAAVSKIVHGRRRHPDIGAELLDNVLTVTTHVWPSHDQESSVTRFDHRILTAIAEIVRRNPHLEIDRLCTAMGERLAQQWISQSMANDKKSTWQVMGERIIERYNKNLRDTGRRISW